MSETKPSVPEWMHKADSNILQEATSSDILKAIAKAYAPERARLRRELLKLVEKWQLYCDYDSYCECGQCVRRKHRKGLADELRALVDRELPVKEGE